MDEVDAIAAEEHGSTARGVPPYVKRPRKPVSHPIRPAWCRSPIGRPRILPKRFATWFFLAPLAHEQPVVIDNSEIVEYRWYTPAAALAAHAEGVIELPAPTFVSLLGFSRFATLASLCAHLRAAAVQRFVPRVVKLADGRATLYAEDAGYAALDLDAPGPRHRLVMRGSISSTSGNSWQAPDAMWPAVRVA